MQSEKMNGYNLEVSNCISKVKETLDAKCKAYAYAQALEEEWKRAKRALALARVNRYLFAKGVSEIYIHKGATKVNIIGVAHNYSYELSVQSTKYTDLFYEVHVTDLCDKEGNRYIDIEDPDYYL